MSQKHQFSFVEERSLFESHAIKAQGHLRRVLRRIKDSKTRRAVESAAVDYFSKCWDEVLPENYFRKRMDVLLDKSPPPKKQAAPEHSAVVSLID